MRLPAFNEDWTDEVKRLYAHDVEELWDRRIAVQMWNRAHGLLDRYVSIAARLAPRNVLDVGCAQGTLALRLAELGYHVTANDLRPGFLDYAAQRHENGTIDFVCGNIFDVTFPKQFDLVFANQIIEHLVFPTEFLSRLKTLVAPGGHIVCTTPSHHYVMNSLPTHKELGDPKQYIDTQYTADSDGHFFAYTIQELTQYARDSGFEPVEPFFFETPWLNGHMKCRFLHRMLPYSVLNILDRLTLAMPWLGKRLSHQIGIIACVP